MPLQMFVFPVLENTPLDPTFAKFLSIPQQPVQVAPSRIAQSREEWLRAWTEAVLR
jgi:thiamine transport system substrate-binding protein